MFSCVSRLQDLMSSCVKYSVQTKRRIKQRGCQTYEDLRRYDLEDKSSKKKSNVTSLGQVSTKISLKCLVFKFRTWSSALTQDNFPESIYTLCNRSECDVCTGTSRSHSDIPMHLSKNPATNGKSISELLWSFSSSIPCSRWHMNSPSSWWLTSFKKAMYQYEAG